MRYTHCPHNSCLICFPYQERTCPLKARGWIEIVDKWALTNRTPRSLDTTAVLGPLSIGSSEAAAVRTANIHQLFDHPEQVIGWITAGESRRAPITIEICRDLKQGWRRYKSSKIPISS